MKKLIIFILLFVDIVATCQNIIINGEVLNENKTGLKDVRIQCLNKKYSLETQTDEAGSFSLVIPDSSANILISKPGYKEVTSNITSNSNLTIILEYADISQLSLEELLKVKVKTVSLKEENITDAPGIISIITGEELRNLGIRTVREALLLMPGFAPFQNDDEQIIAVRGVFATTSQKILFMRNGHALNEGNLDIPQMEFSVSIENIKKIEIIRGPGASIYGNSAFAAVVNIITRDEDEIRVKTAVGNNGYFDFDSYVLQTSNDKSNFSFWGRFANIAGENIDVMVNSPTIGQQVKGTYKSYSYPINYDAGFRYKSKYINSSLSVRKHNYNTYWTIPGNFTNVDSLFWQPHLMQNSVHYNINLNYKINEKSNFNLNSFVDYSTLYNFRLVGNIADSSPHGIIQANEWNVVKTGINGYSTINYSNNGTIIIGLSYEFRKYLDSWVTSNVIDKAYLTLPQRYYPRAHESRLAAFVQANHSFTKWLKVDIGARYDYAEKFNATFNPRLAIITYPISSLAIKAIYTKAFQAPGYSYRNANNTVASFSGSLEVLQPEEIQTYQLSARYSFNKGFVEIASFYNRLENIIARRPNVAYYSNFGKLASYGLETDAHFKIKQHILFARYSILLPDTSYMDQDFKLLYISNNRFKNLPQHALTTGFTLRYLNKVNLSLYSQYTSSYYASNNDNMDSKILLNGSIRLINFHDHFELSTSIYNITDKKYSLGDPSIKPLPQCGRWYSVSLTAKF